jgi:hypothetical protein
MTQVTQSARVPDTQPTRLERTSVLQTHRVEVVASAGRLYFPSRMFSTSGTEAGDFQSTAPAGCLQHPASKVRA